MSIVCRFGFAARRSYPPAWPELGNAAAALPGGAMGSLPGTRFAHLLLLTTAR
jgi:hypothetical protein